MKKSILILVSSLIAVFALGQQVDNQLNLLPEPVKSIRTNGYFKIQKDISIEAPSVISLQPTLQFLKQRLSIPTGYKVSVNQQPSSASIKLILNKQTDPLIGKEGYHLSVTPSNVILRANEAAGLFYGVQSLMQLLPAAIESSKKENTKVWEIPCVEITDYPRFGWRGLMFDVSRHFFTKQEVKDFIDQMSRYKFNLLHWHLTDDEGWRIEIKSLPDLTTKGSKRVDKTGYFNTFWPPLPDEPLNYGGFYTQEDIKEVVQYAKEHFVDILPEIDVPGHSLAAIVAYPELSGTPGSENYRVRSGEKIMDWNTNGTFSALVNNTLSPSNEKVYTFLDKVFTEVATLFPFEYIHVGGDECAKNFWEKNDEIKSLMKKEGLNSMNEVQAYFEKRVGKIINSKGKKLIGWDEILEGGLADNAAVMSWRGEKGGIEAAKLKHEVVMSPTTFTYLDFMQGDEIIEPKVYATLRLNKTYEFEPVPAGVDPKYIKGGQANIWTEQITNTRHLQYMTWPRSFAVAESVWSPKEKKNWNNFVHRVEQQFKRFDIREINYARSMYDPIFTCTNNNGEPLINLSTEVEGLDIYYSFDNSFPDRFYPKYTTPLTPPKDAVLLRTIVYKGNQPIGRMITMPIVEINKRTGIKKPAQPEE